MKQLIKKVTSLVLAAGLFALTATAVLPASGAVYAQSTGGAPNCDITSGGSIQNGINCAGADQTMTKDVSIDNVFKLVVNILLFVIGALCVIMLIFGGIRYTTSAGNSSSVTAAKNTIMYALIGLVVAFLAFAIVNWVLGAISFTP